MKAPVSMIEDILAQVSEGVNLLKEIIKDLPDDEKADSAFGVLIRLLGKTIDDGYEYVMAYPAPPKVEKNGGDIVDDVFHVVINAKKLEEVAHIYNESYFTDKDRSSPKLYMAAVLYDYAIKVRTELESIEEKLI